MTTEATTQLRILCPSCGEKAKRVSLVTLRALLSNELADQLGTDDHSGCESNGDGCKPTTRDTGWRFCDSQACDVVYFSEQGRTTFTKAQLKVAVGVKEASGERPLCYCFNHSVASIKKELQIKRQLRCARRHPGEDERPRLSLRDIKSERFLLPGQRDQGHPNR